MAALACRTTTWSRDAKLVIFEDSSHMAFVEERESYLRVVEDFLARTEARASS